MENSYKDRIREERKRLRFTQDEFAAALSLSRPTIAFYEAGRSLPDIAALDRAGRAGADVQYLVTGQRASEAVMSQFNWELHEKIIKGICEWATESNMKIPPDKFAVLVRLLYEKFSKSQTVECQVMKEVLRLVA